jgi:hypothetical protein
MERKNRGEGWWYERNCSHCEILTCIWDTSHGQMTDICLATGEILRCFYSAVNITYQLRVIYVITELTICEILRAMNSLFRHYKRIIAFENSIL